MEWSTLPLLTRKHMTEEELKWAHEIGHIRYDKKGAAKEVQRAAILKGRATG